jgi:HK97 family phage portal protein
MIWPGLRRIWQQIWEGRTSLENPQTPLGFPAEWAMDIFSGGRTDSGLRVSQLTALQVPYVLACVTRIAGAIAAQPMRVYERVDSEGPVSRHAKRVAIEHPLYDVIRYQPNDEMTHASFIRTFMAHALLWGNGYAEIQRDAVGRPVALWPRNPTRTRPRRLLHPLPDNPGNLYPLVYITHEGLEQTDQNYSTDVGTSGVERVILKENMLHVPGLALDGRLGQDTIWLSRQAIGLSLAAEKFAAKYFGNNATPSGVLETPNAMKKENRDALRNMWMEAQGGENWGRIALLESGVKFTKISSTPNEAQMIEARKQQMAEIAAIFGMHPIMLGETGAARANAEQVALEWVNYTLKPWTNSIEEEFKVKLFPRVTIGRNAGRSFMALIDMRSLELPDAASKANYYRAARNWGWATPNDILEEEDENPLPGKLGESYLVPVNMVAVDADGKVILQPPRNTSANQPSGPANIPGQGVDQPRQEKVAREVFWPIFRDAFGRFAARDSHDYKVINSIFRPILESMRVAKGESADNVNAQLRSFEGLQAGALTMEAVNETARKHFDYLWSNREVASGRLFLVRHGETENDLSGVSDEFVPEEPLTTAGETKAQVLAGYVAANIPDLRWIYCGTPKRHQQTAEAIAAGKGFTVDSSLNGQGEKENDSAFKGRIVVAVDGLRQDEDTLIVTSHRAIGVYAEHLGNGAEDIEFCSLWEVTDDGVRQIFKPGV